MPERLFGPNESAWRASVPDFRDMPAGGVTDDAGEGFGFGVGQDFSRAPASAAVEGGVHLLTGENGETTPSKTDESKEF